MPEDTGTIVLNARESDDENLRRRVAVLTCMRGGEVGRRILLADDRITLGRSPEATIMLRDSYVSRVHLEVSYDGTLPEYRIKDLGSSNGTMLNQRPVSESPLTDSDKIGIGRTLLRFSWVDALDLKYQSDIDQLLNIDELTGLIVKRRFDEEVNRQVAIAKKQGSALAMLMMDMDGLKQINDTYGHSFGAYAIAETGKTIKEVIAKRGLASRFGGDEFMAFMPDTDLEEARCIAEEIRERIESHSFIKDGVRLRPTICIGVSALKGDDSVESCQERADKALYQSKNSGRNRVTTCN